MGWVVNGTTPALSPKNDPVPILYEGGRTSAPVWTSAENLAPVGIQSQDRPTRSESLCRLRYPGPRSFCEGL